MSDDHHPSAWGPHDWRHGAPHNSWAPFILSLGVAIFLFTLAGAFKFGEFQGWGSVPMIFVGLGVTGISLIVWWRQDMSFGMNGEVFEPKSAGAPFQNIDIRKVAMWMFLMSEMMVFTSLFSTYMRYRFGIMSSSPWLAVNVVLSPPPVSAPCTAPAALARILRVKGFRPRMSPTENIIVMSLMST